VERFPVDSDEGEAAVSDPAEALIGSTRSIPIDFDAGPIVGPHRVILRALRWFPDVWGGRSDRGEYLDLSYSFQPPLTEEERSTDFPRNVWTLTVTDDVGTDYDSSTGGLGASGGDREIHPAPPTGAETLTLSIGTPLLGWDGEPRPSQVVEELMVDLRTGKVSPSEHADGLP
jgi:hypothetical protein